jgi:uridine monophosphate synthetase
MISGMLLLFLCHLKADNPGKAADSIRQAINDIRQTHYRWEGYRRAEEENRYQLADMLLEKGCIKFAAQENQFILKSGLRSPIYIDLRRLVTFPELLKTVAAAYLPILSNLNFNRLAALPYAAIPIATAISLAGNWPMVYPRKEQKQYGTKAEIEGEYFPEELVVVIDDLITTGSSKFEAIQKLTNASLVVKDIVVLIDRQSGAAESLASRGYRLHAVYTLNELLDHWETTKKLSRGQIRLVREFLSTQEN